MKWSRFLQVIFSKQSFAASSRMWLPSTLKYNASMLAPRRDVCSSYLKARLKLFFSSGGFAVEGQSLWERLIVDWEKDLLHLSFMMNVFPRDCILLPLASHHKLSSCSSCCLTHKSIRCRCAAGIKVGVTRRDFIDVVWLRCDCRHACLIVPNRIHCSKSGLLQLSLEGCELREETCADD